MEAPAVKRAAADQRAVWQRGSVESIPGRLAQRLALVAHDGLARSINPVHSPFDGDTLFAIGTGLAGKSANLLLLGTMAAEVTAQAVVRAVLAARGVSAGGMSWPAACDL